MTFIDDDRPRYPVMLTIPATAALLGQRVSTTRRYCREQLLDSVVLGNKRLVRQDSVFRLLAEGSAGVKARRASLAAALAPAHSAAPAPSTVAAPLVRLFCTSDVACIRGYQSKLADPDRQVRDDARWQLGMFYKTTAARAESIPTAEIDPESLAILASLKPTSPAPVPVVAPARQEAPAATLAPAKPAVSKTASKFDLAALTALAAGPPPPEPENYEQYEHRVQAEKLAALREAVKTASPELQAAFAGWETLKAG
jgi:hypothetical protein